MTDGKEDGEKLFSPEKINDSKSSEAAKFIPESETKNGISPVSVDSIKSTFTGLTKEELMKYANDPFWVRIRWFLFIAFWLIWLLMLFGAIFIIIVTPKCKEQPPPLWWQKSPLYKIDIVKLLAKNQTSGNESVIDVVKNKIDHLKSMGIESLLIDSVLESDKEASNQIMNYTNVNYYLESLSKFRKDIIGYAKSKNVRVMLSFTPNHSGKNELFIRSSLKEDNYYKDLYVWYSDNYTGKPDTYPNNWISIYDEPAWEWNTNRKQFYLHQFHTNQPDFNFRNPAIIKFFADVFEFWLNFGIEGFHLDKAEYLVEDEQFRDETVSHNTSFSFLQYGFYNHFRTRELPETANIIANWSSLIKNHSGILSVSGGINERKDIANFVLRPLIFSPNITAVELNERIIKWSNIVNQPTWEWQCGSKIECIPKSAVDGLSIVSFLLPGTPVIKLGEEFNPADASALINQYDEKNFEKVLKEEKSNPESHYNIMKHLIELRARPSITFGDFSTKVLNETTFAFTRIKVGSPGFLIAWNIGNATAVVNFKEFPKVPEDLMVVIKSGRLFNDSYPLKSRVRSSKVNIPSMAAIVFSFVPVSK